MLARYYKVLQFILARLPTLASQEFYAWGAALGKRMGQIPLHDGQPVEYTDRLSASGEIERDGLPFHFDYLMFRHPELGLPTFTACLCRQGFSDFKYHLVDLDGVRGD